MGNPENKERPNVSEQRPKPQPSDATKRALGNTAIGGAQKK